MTVRALIVAVLLVFTSAYLGYADRAEPTPIRRTLAEFPLSLGDWVGRQEPPLSAPVLKILRLDDYTVRSYARGDKDRVWFYVGYHATQRQGASIHSPLNCLPGSGWIPARLQRVHISVESPSGPTPRTIEVNRVLIEKGVDRQVVLYWYQSHGRVVASEYWGKFYGVVDAIRTNRTDAALVRVIAPVRDGDIEAAERDATDFVRQAFPVLTSHLPS